MRLLLGMILGAILTVSAAYVHDSAPAGEIDHRDMVNWDVVAENWQAAKTRAQQAWTQLSSRG